ncbi:hypothetical protein FRB91_011888 [Serendipita sp. 411]|nr:hypothetical protein FRB91_011888 [Serendipita sp. 411]
MITVLESAQASIKNSEAWEALRATLERHRSLLTRHFERAEEEGTRRKADPNLLEILLDYGDALEDILVCVLKEMGVSEEDIPPSTGTNLKRKLAKVGLTGLEAERIKGYSDRLSTALQHLMTALQVHTAVEISKIHDKLDRGPQKQKLIKKALSVFKGLREISKQNTILEAFRELVTTLPSAVELLDLNDTEYSVWQDVASALLNHHTSFEELTTKLENADMQEDPKNPIGSYLSLFVSELESALSIFIYLNGVTRRDIPRELSNIQTLVDKGLNGMVLSNIQSILTSALDKIKIITGLYTPDADETVSHLGRSSVFAGSATGSGMITPYGAQHKRCLPGTRIVVIQQIDEWINSSQGKQPIYVLGDVAGTGKSTIAAEVTYRWEKEQLLASRFFFSRGNSGTSTATDLCIHLARDLSVRYPHLQDQLSKPLEEAASIFQFDKLWEKLVFEPLSQLTEKTVLVIDGLDECTPASREDFLEALLRDFGQSNPLVHFFITTRLEDEITSLLQSRQDVVLARVQQTEQQRRANVRDIARYIEFEFEKMKNPPMNHQSAQRLLERADGLFIFASTVCAVLAKSFERQRLFDDILNYKGFTNLDGLYLGILQRVLPSDPFSRQALNDVLGVILAAREPLSIAALQACCPNVSSVRGIVESLGSVLSLGGELQQSDAETFVSIIHQTFRDFLLQKKRSCDYALNVHTAHSTLADACFQTLQRGLHPRMAETFSGGEVTLDTDLDEISTSLRAKSEPLLCYSAVYWISHTIPVLYLHGLHEEIRTIFTEKLTSWVEVVALLRGLIPIMTGLSRLQDLMKRYGDLPGHQFANADTQWCLEAVRLLQNNQTLLQSAPWQVYTSPLVFLGEDDLISKHYRLPQFPIIRKAAVPLSISGFSLNWGEPITLRGHRLCINCVDWSVDGKCIASGSDDHTVVLWDAVTGANLITLYGHTGPITCVKFSPSGAEVVSSSEDGTIRRWKRDDGACIGDPWKSVEGAARCFAFSSDSRDLVYGTTVGLVCRVDAETGRLIETPQRAHVGPVNALSISSDGAYMATAGDDGALWMWYWTPHEKPLVPSHTRRHQSPILSATFIPNTSTIVYTAFGLYTCDVLSFGTNGIQKDEEEQHTCIAVSNDMESILTGSNMQTIWTWKTEVLDGSAGHIRHGEMAYANIRCLAYSPNGRSSVSGSSDSTLKIWETDLPSTPAFAFPQRGRPSMLMMLAFSHDGESVAAVGSDGAFKIWEFDTGKLQLGPIATGSPLTAVAFHPNGQFLACGKTVTDVSIWSAFNGEPIRRNLLNDEGYKELYALEFSSNGRLFATADHYMNISLWSFDPTFTVPSCIITNIRFSPDGPNAMVFDPSQQFLTYRNQAWYIGQPPASQVPEEHREQLIDRIIGSPLHYDDYAAKKHGRKWIDVESSSIQSLAVPLEFDGRRHAIFGGRIALGAKLGDVMFIDFRPTFHP